MSTKKGSFWAGLKQFGGMVSEANALPSDTRQMHPHEMKRLKAEREKVKDLTRANAALQTHLQALLSAEWLRRKARNAGVKNVDDAVLTAALLDTRKEDLLKIVQAALCAYTVPGYENLTFVGNWEFTQQGQVDVLQAQLRLGLSTSRDHRHYSISTLVRMFNESHGAIGDRIKQETKLPKVWVARADAYGSFVILFACSPNLKL